MENKNMIDPNSEKKKKVKCKKSECAGTSSTNERVNNPKVNYYCYRLSCTLFTSHLVRKT